MVQRGDEHLDRRGAQSDAGADTHADAHAHAEPEPVTEPVTNARSDADTHALADTPTDRLSSLRGERTRRPCPRGTGGVGPATRRRNATRSYSSSRKRADSRPRRSQIAIATKNRAISESP